MIDEDMKDSLNSLVIKVFTVRYVTFSIKNARITPTFVGRPFPTQG